MAHIKHIAVLDVSVHHLSVLNMGFIWLLVTMVPSSFGNHAHYQSYLEHRDFYMKNFNEMLNRKGDMYKSKHNVRMTIIPSADLDMQLMQLKHCNGE